MIVPWSCRTKKKATSGSGDKKAVNGMSTSMSSSTNANRKGEKMDKPYSKHHRGFTAFHRRSLIANPVELMGCDMMARKSTVRLDFAVKTIAQKTAE